MDSVPSYNGVHARLTRLRGRAADQVCAHCGDTAYQWALTGEPKWSDPRAYTDDLDAYTPLCGSCHARLDRGLPPCPHGPERDRRPDGTCRACQTTRKRALDNERYANDPEFREAKKAQARARYARQRASRLDADPPIV